jgi:transaldolase
MGNAERVWEKVHALAREGFSGEFGKPKQKLTSNAEWQKLRATGTRLWLDTGDIDEAAKLFTAEFDALTTNNTLLNKEVQKGIYDGLVKKAAGAIREAAPDIDARTLLLEIAFVLNAYHGLRLVERFDAFVSVELHTDLAHDVERSLSYAKRYHAICPERFIVKVPFTPAGLLTTRKLGVFGIPVNFTLGFSARQNYVAALVANPEYVNVFMGRIGAFLADNKLGSGEQAGEKATLATQRALLALRAAGRSHSRLIGASMRGGPQVGALAGLDVYTMPPKVAAEYLAKPLAEVRNEVEKDPAAPFAAGVTSESLHAEALWDVSAPFKACVDALMKLNIDGMTPEVLQAHFQEDGFGDFLPEWSDEDVKAATRDGKIPVYSVWRERLTAGEVGLDALLNLSALQSFTTDQKALDDRVQSLI